MAIEAVWKLCLCNPAVETHSVLDTERQFLESHFPTQHCTNIYQVMDSLLKSKQNSKMHTKCHDHYTNL